MKINIKKLKENEFKPIQEAIHIGQLVFQLDETLDDLILNLQKKMLEHLLPPNSSKYCARDFLSGEVNGIKKSVEEINEHFGTDYESDPIKIYQHYNKPAKK